MKTVKVKSKKRVHGTHKGPPPIKGKIMTRAEFAQLPGVRETELPLYINKDGSRIYEV